MRLAVAASVMVWTYSWRNTVAQLNRPNWGERSGCGATRAITRPVQAPTVPSQPLPVIRAEKPFAIKKGKGYYWSVTGLLIGIIAVVSFWASYKFGGFTRGLSFTTPTRELFFTLFTGESRSTFFPNYSFGFLKITWGIPFILGVPLGAYLSCRGLKEFTWKTPRDPMELLTVMLGSLLMGFGGTLAVGCNIGQGLTGLSTLSVGSLFAAIAIVLGNWTMVYFKFIKPMKDLDV